MGDVAAGEEKGGEEEGLGNGSGDGVRGGAEDGVAEEGIGGAGGWGLCVVQFRL